MAEGLGHAGGGECEAPLSMRERPGGGGLRIQTGPGYFPSPVNEVPVPTKQANRIRLHCRSTPASVTSQCSWLNHHRAPPHLRSEPHGGGSDRFPVHTQPRALQASATRWIAIMDAASLMESFLLLARSRTAWNALDIFSSSFPRTSSRVQK